MCGILGWYNYKKTSFSENERDRFQAGLDAMAHRGPDADAVRLVDKDLLFGHRRLSIIDLSATNNQPFVTRDGNYTLVFNGEIFNYKEIREELVSKGYSFDTNGDTEVLIYAYDLWGQDCVNRFNGMWAFSLFDKAKDILFCSRDRFGIKPFNYHLTEDSFSFSSESKSLLKLYPNKFKPNFKVIGNFLRKTVGGQLEETWFDGIKRLLPAHNMVFTGGRLKTYRYWQYPLNSDRNISKQDASYQYLELLEDAVKLRMRSDVPVGTTLSSGLDSTSLVALMRRFYDGEHNTYTAFSNQKDFHKLENSRFSKNVSKDESEIVRNFSKPLNLKNNFVNTNHDNYLEQLDKLIFFLEAPHQSQSIIPLFQLLAKARNDVTVLLEGQGADELLGGYISKNAFAFSHHLLKKGKLISGVKNLLSFKKHYNLSQAFQLYIRSLDLEIAQKYFQSKSAYSKLYTGEIAKVPMLKDSPFESPDFDDGFNKYLHAQHTGTLVDLLHYGDRISMANSIESRLPFMDYRLVEFAFKLPAKHKVENGVGKLIHRNAMKNVLPEYITNNPYKFGFTTPLAKIFMDDSKLSPSNKLVNGRAVATGLIDGEHLMSMLQQHREEKVNHSRVLYRLCGLESWLDQYQNE